MHPRRFRWQLTHWQFCLCFGASLYLLGNAPNFARLARWFQDGDGIDVSAFAAYLAAGLGLFVAILALVAHRRILKAFAIVLVIASAGASYFVSKYGVAIDSSMILNVVHTDVVEVGQLLSWQMTPYAIGLTILPLVLVVRTGITFAPGGRYWWQSAKLLGASLLLVAVALSAEYQAIFRAGNASNKYIVYTLVPLNVISGSINAAGKSLRPYLRESQDSIQFDARVGTSGDLVVVLVVGESSRRKNFSLYGYERTKTTPLLAQVPGLRALDGVADRASTLYALPRILAKDGINLTTVTSRAGIPTRCFVNYTLYDNCSGVGEVKVSNCAHGGKCYDEDVIPLLREDLRSYSSGYRFVVLHLGGGSHGPLYGDRHPPEFRRFLPTCDDADVANRCSADQLYNSYDNTILYVDHVLNGIIGVLDASRVPYAMIYLSDHGESLLEEGRLFHGVPPGMSLPPEQAEIPLLVKSSIPVDVVERPVYRQPEVFDSVLNLFSIESREFDKSGSFLEKAAVRSEQ